jgi:hypothetical protein
MFLVRDSNATREIRIKQFLSEDASLSVLLAVINFEWTVRRAIIALGTSPNVTVRARLKQAHGLGKYKDAWKVEVYPRFNVRLPDIVQNWNDLNSSFNLRHKLVHGVTSCGEDYATERALWALTSTNYIRDFCLSNGIDLDKRLPVRKLPKPTDNLSS